MKKYRSYFRAVFLSMIAAFILDAIINFDQYKRGYLVLTGKDKEKEYSTKDTPLAEKIRKVSVSL
jgi:hypothetical protein